MDQPLLAISAGERHRVERMLAAARALLAIGAALLLGLDQFAVSGLGSVFGIHAGLIALYVLHSFIVLSLLRRRERSATFRVAVHAADLCWPIVLAMLLPRADDTSWVLVFFAVYAAAYRWGSWETLTTAGVALVLIVIEPTLRRLSMPAAMPAGASLVAPRELALRAAYVLLVGVSLAYLAARANRRRAERAAIARLARTPRPTLGATRTLHAILDQLRSLMQAREALIVVREVAAGRSFLWHVRTPVAGGASAVHMSELDQTEEQRYLFAADANGWDIARPSRGRPQCGVAVDASGRPSLPPPAEDMAPLVASHSCDGLIVVSFAFEQEWIGRAFVLDPKAVRDREGRLRFLQAAIRELSPALHNTYLLRRIRSRAAAVERARLARELHDGLTQSLIGAQIHLDLACRNLSNAPARVASDLEDVRRILQREISNLRDLMRVMKTADVPPAQLPGALAESVERFERETGIAARLVSSTVDPILLSQRTCTELARILREALVNVRRHSGARHVLVSFGAKGDRYTLIVEDDGRGFAGARQPAAIAESVRVVSGSLTVQSSPGEGTRIEVSVRARDTKGSQEIQGDDRSRFPQSQPLGKLAMAKVVAKAQDLIKLAR